MLKDRLKSRKLWIALIAGAGALGLAVGILLPLEKLRENAGSSGGLGSLGGFGNKPATIGSPSAVLSPLVAKPPAARAASLKAEAQKSSPSLERNRARYLLASDLIAQNQGVQALELLKDLEKDYSVLSAQVLIKRAQAYQSAGKQQEAIDTWQTLIKQHAKDPASVEGLFVLGKDNPKYWDQAIALFPAHPRSVEIAQARYKKDPKNLPALMLLAKYGTTTQGYTQMLDVLTSKFAAQLKPEDWETIAFGYWENQVYDKGALAYARAPVTPVNLYRSARGLHLSGKPGGAERYRLVVQQFPKSDEAGLALTRLAALADQPQSAIAYLDQVAQNFPDRAAAALVEKSKLLDKMNSAKSAAQTRQLVLSQYGNSDAAAEMRWAYAKERAKAGDFKLARQWAEPIVTNNSTSAIAAEAGFWSGKWAQKLGQDKEARKFYETVLKSSPESYFAWRSASLLGWNVGDFNTVRSLNPQVQKPVARPELPAGSSQLKELYQLGQERDAWSYWQVEFQNRTQPSVAEQFTDGVLRLGVGNNLDGIYMVGSLRDRDKPEDKAQYQQLRKSNYYWQALYPFPYVEDIENWSQQRQLNPMLVTALIRQESRFEPKIKSSVGAVGLMQVMPDTATFIAESVKQKQFNLENPQDNIKFGTWYLDHTHQEYQNNSMLAVASYNAGPNAVADWLGKSKTQDPDEFVERIPYDETRGYVKSVLGNYWNYLRLYNPDISRQIARISPDQPTLHN
jgi:soluble lytic murein transglycosylase